MRMSGRIGKSSSALSVALPRGTVRNGGQLERRGRNEALLALECYDHSLFCVLNCCENSFGTARVPAGRFEGDAGAHALRSRHRRAVSMWNREEMIKTSGTWDNSALLVQCSSSPISPM